MRFLLLLLWLAAVIFAALEYFDASEFGELSQIPAVVSFALTLVVFLPFLASGFDWFSKWLLKLPLGRARRKTFRKLDEPFEGAHKQAYFALREKFTEPDSPRKSSPGVILADALGAFAPAGTAWPRDLHWVPEWLRNSAQAVEDSVIVRLLIPERARTVAASMRAMAAAHAHFIRGLPAPTAELQRTPLLRDSSHPALFADFVTRFTGAIALVDATQTRTGRASNVQVWHSTRYAPAADDATTFLRGHGVGGAAAASSSSEQQCQWREKLRASGSSRVGDYDGRVLNLGGAALTTDPTSGELTFLLTTDETCYAATELSPQACKGPIGTVARAEYDAPWSRDRDELVVTKTNHADKRLNMFTVLAALILTSQDKRGPRRSMLLSERSRGLRNGSGVLSVVGGVMNLHHDNEGGDVDESGFADPRMAISREIREELGFVVPPDEFTPTVLYTFNQRSASREVSEARAQLLTTLSFTAHLRMSLDEVRVHQATTSLANGRYELDDIIELELPYPNAKVRDNSGRDTANRECAQKFARSVLPLARRLDQAAIVAILYASVEAYTLAATVAAFDDVWKQPWYMHPWVEDAYTGPSVGTDGVGRLARTVSSQIDEEWMRDVRAVNPRGRAVPD